MTYSIPIGLDLGNSRASVCFIDERGKEHIKSLLSASASGNIRELAAVRAGMTGTTYQNPYDCLEEGEIVFSYNGGPDLFLGELAYTQGKRASTGTGDVNRYHSDRARAFALALPALLLQEQMISTQPTTLEIVTGLPVEVFKEKEHERLLKQKLRGTHHFAVNGKPYMTTIHIGKVLMEGAGASLRLGYPTDRLCGIIDIGWFTTDVYAFRGVHAESTLCGGIDIGIRNVAARMSERCMHAYQRALTQKECLDILYAYTSGNIYPAIDTPDGNVPSMILQSWAHISIWEIGGEISEFVADLWRTDLRGRVAGNFYANGIGVGGGGAYTMTEVIAARIPNAQMIRDPEHANVRGYQWLAETLLEASSASASEVRI